MSMKKKLLITMMLSGMLGLAACGGQASDGAQIDQAPIWEDIDWAEPISFEGVAAADSDIYVAPVEGMTDDFLRGVDVSSYLSEIESGVIYKDFEGNELDEQGFFELLAECGVNCVRLRVWNDPYDKDGNGYGGGNNDLESAIKMGHYASAAGMQVLIDFHYSDFWADPAKQKSPKEWAHYTIEDKEQALYDFTKDSLNALLDAEVNVTMVQIGNEINNGMSGETDWTRIAKLMRKGSEAIRGVSKERGKEIQIAVHFTNPESVTFTDYAKKMKDKEIDYDVFATSYYPFWHGTMENLTNQLSYIADTYDKKVMVAETSYLYTGGDGDGHSNSISADTAGIALGYDISEQGQANEVRDVMQAVKNVGDAGIGVFYWEPAWIPVKLYDAEASDAQTILAGNKEAWEKHGSGWASSYAGKYDAKDAGLYYGGSSWDNQAMFDYEGNPLESLRIFRYVFGGTNTSVSIVRVDDFAYESGIGQDIVMPQTVEALQNNNEKKAIPVTWDETQVAKAQEAGAGLYEISGVAQADGQEYAVICNLEIKKINYVKNFGFEEIDMAMWDIQGKGVGRTMDNNKKSGDYSLKFWSEEPVSYSAEQTVTEIPEGTYELGAFLQGGDAGSNPIFELYIIVNGKKISAMSKVTTWQNWDNPVISDISIPADADVIIGVKVEAAGGAWGAWDDFYLYEAE